VVLAEQPGPSEISIGYDGDPGRDLDSERTFPELLELARAAADVVAGARPLAPRDLVPPEEAASLAEQPDAEAAARAAQAIASLTDVHDRLARALAADGHAGLEGGLREAAGFGAAGAFPPAGETDAALVERGRSVLAELERRVAQAQGAATPAEAVRSVFGNGFVFLPRFRPAAPAALAQALAAESELAVPRWLEGAARVRAGLGRWRLLSILAGALGSTPARFDVAQ